MELPNGETIESNRCLRQSVTPTSWEFLRLYKHFKHGVMPFSGGLLDQPARFIDAMEVIDGQIS